MKFHSMHRGARYVIEPRRYMVLPNGDKRLETDEHGNVRGLAADFRRSAGGSMFDSEEAQQKNGWTDDQREQVELYLQSHADFGHGLYVAAEEVGERPTAAATCMVMIALPGGGVRLCGKAAGSEGVCTDHVAALRATPELAVDEPLASDPDPTDDQTPAMPPGVPMVI